MIDFARDVCGTPLDPWQEWLSIHVGELLSDGRPRFRTVIALVARQNGKSTWARALVLYWMYIDLPGSGDHPFVLGTSTDRGYAKKFWNHTGQMIQRNPLLAPELLRIHRTPSEESIITTRDVEYGFAANNSSAGRSRTISRALVDEVRQHKSLNAYGAITGAMNAVPYGQLIAISNQGDDEAILLDTLRKPAIEYLETGRGDPRLGLFEWSSEAGSDPTDPHALAMANPNLGRRVDLDALMGQAQRAVIAGGAELASFRTEVMCMRVDLLDPAIDPELWRRCSTTTPLSLAGHRDKVALCLDVSLDSTHVCLIAAAVVDGVTHVEVARAWQGRACLADARRELPGLVAKIRPRAIGWFPAGPSAALAADLAERRGAVRWPPRGVTVDPITTDTAAVCMALPELVRAGEITHPSDPMLDAHVGSAQRLTRINGTWVFQRKGTGPVNGVYAMAGAVHLARTLPAPPAPLIVI